MASSEAFEFGTYTLVLAKDTSFSIIVIICTLYTYFFKILYLLSSIRYKLACAYREVSILSAHPHSLIRVLIFCLKKR